MRTWEEAERLAPGVDAVVVDLWMPDIELDALERVRALAPDATLAVVTALDLDEARSRIGDRGVDLLLSKLVPPVEIASAIAAHARQRATG